MKLAILHKTAVEQFWVALLIVLGAAVFPLIFMHAILAFPWEMFSQFLETPFFQTIIKVLTGAKFERAPDITMMGAFVFVHPVMLALGWSCAIVGATRALAGEIESGTADLLLAMPATRLGVYVSVSGWVIGTTIMIPLAAWVGLWIGARTAELPEPLTLWTYRFVVVNGMAMLLAVSCIALLISSASSRRGKAMGAAFGILLSSFLLNWLAAFWPAAERLAYLGILRYFRPFAIIKGGAMIWSDVLLLLAVAVTAWIGGGVWFVRRDIHTS